MIDTTFTFSNGTVVDLHYLVAIQPKDGLTCWVYLHYQLCPKPVEIMVGTSKPEFSRDEYDYDMARLNTAWQRYKEHILSLKNQ